MAWKIKLKEKPFKILRGDCIKTMRLLPSNSVDAVVCDPPYAIGFMGKEFDTFKSNKHYMRFSYKWAKEAFRILKPGGYLLAFSGTRTYHYAAVGIEEAGFTCRDMISWIYGSGFPKSHNISKSIDKQLKQKGGFGGFKTKAHASRKSLNVPEGWDRPWMQDKKAIENSNSVYIPASKQAEHFIGYGTNLKPCQEPIAVFQKHISEKTIAANCLKWGTGAIDINAGRVKLNLKVDSSQLRTLRQTPQENTSGQKWGTNKNKRKAVVISPDGRWPGNIILSYPEDEYTTKSSITKKEKQELLRWLDENT